MRKIHMQANGLRTATACGITNPYTSMVSREEFAQLLTEADKSDDPRPCPSCARIAQLSKTAPQQGPHLDSPGEFGYEWQDLVKRLKAAQDNGEGMVLTDRDVLVLNRALKALAGYIIHQLKGHIGRIFKAMGLDQ